MGEILALMEETLSGLRIIKAFNAEKKMDGKFSGENEAYRRIQNRLMRRRSLAHPMSEFLGTIVIVIVLWFGGKLVLNHQSNLSAEGFIAYIALFYSIINPAKNLTNAYYSVQKGLAAMVRIDVILSANPPFGKSKNRFVSILSGKPSNTGMSVSLTTKASRY